MKKLTLIVPFSLSYLFAISQEKVEQLRIGWPPEYKWQVVSQKDDSTQMSTIIIPGYEKVSNATILGTMRVMKGIRQSNSDQMVAYYKSHLDIGSKLTVVDKLDGGAHPWVLFKIETPATTKYPVPESDLYFVIQGEFGVYENYVAIKESSLSKDFTDKWTKVFKSGEFVMQ